MWLPGLAISYEHRSLAHTSETLVNAWSQFGTKPFPTSHFGTNPVSTLPPTVRLRFTVFVFGYFRTTMPLGAFYFFEVRSLYRFFLDHGLHFS
jgi:hypothetical protein